MTKDESKRKILEQWAQYMPDPNRAEYQDKLKFYDWFRTLTRNYFNGRLEPKSKMARNATWLNERIGLGPQRRGQLLAKFPFVLVVVGALFVFAGDGADGTSKKVYYAIATCLWILAAVIAYLLLLLRFP